MSDTIQDLSKRYEDNVLCEHHPRSIGLFPIPEYPEYERRGMWPAALETVLTTLRYLAPATLLTLFWGQQSFLFKLLKYIDSAFRAVFFSSDEQKTAVLKWLEEVSPVEVDCLDTLWENGWILCGVLDATLPGACAGHPPSKLSIKHAQAIADHYLGVEQVFTRQELESNDALSKHQEWKLVNYLDRIKEALSKVTLPISKPTSQRSSPETIQCTLDYVAKGSGLTAAQVNNVMFFKIYPTGQQSFDPGEIKVLIRGPKDTYGMTVLPPLLGKAQIIRQKLLGLKKKVNYTENALPITQGATYMRTFGKNDMSKTYHIPKANYDIEIEAELQQHYAKIGYLVSIPGKYEISISSRGQNILGSPFSVTATSNIISILEQDSFCLEDGEEIDIVDVNTDKKVVLRIVDFVTEKMLLKENGSFEKITDEEAKYLINTENNEIKTQVKKSEKQSLCNVPQKNHIFKQVAKKVMAINEVLKLFNEIKSKKPKEESLHEQTYISPNIQRNIPDIVNSTFGDVNLNPFSTPTILHEKIESETIGLLKIPTIIRTEEKNKKFEDLLGPLTNEGFKQYENVLEDESGRTTPSNNPFIDDNYTQTYVNENKLGMFVNTEYETNRAQTEETHGSAIKIIVEKDPEEILPERNTFLEPDVINLERPKTPILKIITGEIQDRKESVYVDALTEKVVDKEFMNPFHTHSHISDNEENTITSPITDFIIGAPVSFLPNIRIPSPESCCTDQIIKAHDTSIRDNSFTVDIKESEKTTNEVFSTPLHENYDPKNVNIYSAFQSFESSLTDNENRLPGYYTEPEMHAVECDPFVAARKDIWDSAYVSIDDINISPDSNNNEKSLPELTIKQNTLNEYNLGYKPEDLSKMGPAELEIWQNSGELPICFEESKQVKFDHKRPMFIPIIEECEKPMSQSTTADCSQKALVLEGIEEPDPVTVAFAEINSLYNKYFSNSESSSTTTINEEDNIHTKNKEYTLDHKDIHVDSASECLSDVKRHVMEIEGAISEVQANVTESVSVSQTLHCIQPNQMIIDDCCKNTIQSGDEHNTNIVLERKKYWDEKIRQVEIEQECDTSKMPKKKRLSAKHLRHNDSLTKKRGKEMVKRIVSTDKETVKLARRSSLQRQMSIDKEICEKESHLVEKWKRYWDDKLETQDAEKNIPCFNPNNRTQKNKRKHSPRQSKIDVDDTTDFYKKIDHDFCDLPRKELPEEVFKAFETSPKRFFGTSRKQILNKIDSFLGQSSAADETMVVDGGANQESGLVSSKISLFHNLSQKEDFSWKQWKSRSMHDINHHKEHSRVLHNSLSRTSIDTEIITFDNQSCDKLSQDHENDNFAFVEKTDISSNHKPLKDKRARLVNKIFNKSVDDVPIHREELNLHNKTSLESLNTEEKIMQSVNNQDQHVIPKIKFNLLRKTSFSKSEMDIFSRNVESTQEDMEKYKSCDELPKINVKSFISLYESVSKSSLDQPSQKLSRKNSFGSQQICPPDQVSAENIGEHTYRSTFKSKPTLRHLRTESINFSIDEEQKDTEETLPLADNPFLEKGKELTNEQITDNNLITQNDNDKESTYISLSDIELEIIENVPEKETEKLPEQNVDIDKGYKSRFKMAKDYFKSLEDSKEDTYPPKLNECEMLLYNFESPERQNRLKKRTKKNLKSRSMDSSEISKIWLQLQEKQQPDTRDHESKLVTTHDKFNVDGIFADVTEGKLSRQGSLRGIPHKKAVLEAFRSMENLTETKLSPYEIALCQLKDFAEENHIKNAQTYLSEYPYLPKTDPSKYHSRIDIKASGLISMKELLNKKPRRNSVPDLRLNTKFVVDL